jgi:hypothetical protein
MITRICTRCLIEKELNQFVKTKFGKFGVTSDCKECRRKIGKEYYKQNKLNINKKHDNYYQENKKYILKKNKINHKDKKSKFPWRYTLKLIKQRCNNSHNIAFKYYGGKGIKCLITSDELKYLWFRDKAYLMKKPSIERKNSDGNYEINNCEYLELALNSKKMNQNKRKLK